LLDWLFPLGLLLALTACAEQHHGEIEQPPYYVHFAADVSREDRDVWGAAAADLNEPTFAATGEYLYFVGSGPARGVCGVEVRRGDDLAIERGSCLTVITYVPGQLDVGVALQVLEELAGGAP
jgi:hypothetical protein